MNSVNSTDQIGGAVELDFDKSISDGVNIYARRDGDASLDAPTRRAGVRRRRKSDEGGPATPPRLPRRSRTKAGPT